MLLTLPQLAEVVGVEYRTLHSWLQRGLVQPSMQRSSGTGVPNLFSSEDAVKAKVIADLRQAGMSFQLLAETASSLDAHTGALTHGAIVLVNGSVSIVDADAAAAAIRQQSLSLVYNTEHAVDAIRTALAGSRATVAG
jgi:DNA-binding transcriptional MerR regulator